MKNIPKTKVCRSCKNELGRERFFRSSQSLDGLCPYCKTCSYNKKLEWEASHPDKKRLHNKTWKLKNKNFISDYGKSYYEINKERIAEVVKIYRKNNPDKLRETRRRIRAYRSGCEGTITELEWTQLVEFYNNTCLRCKRDDVDLTLDHIVPLKLGGPNIIENAQPLCQSCNSKKGIQVIDYR